MQKIVFLGVFVAALAVGSLAADLTVWPAKTCATASQDADCGTDRGLKCLDATKGCACEGEKVFYLGELNKCVIPNGKQCQNDNDVTPNSKCNAATPKVVECDAGFTFNSVGKCIQDPTKACTVDTGCDDAKFQVCLPNSVPADRRCGCASGLNDSTTDKCIRKATEACTEGAGDYTPTCSAFATCKGKTCTCAAEFDANDNKECRVKHGGDCSKGAIDQPCNELVKNHKCHDTEKKCLCEGEGDTTFFDTKKCVLRLDKACEPGAVTDKLECADDSNCNATSKVCECDAGLNKGQGLTCVALPGKECTGGAGDKCDKEAFLKCSAADGVKGTCACENANTIIDKNGVCKIKAGQPCVEKSGTPCVAESTCSKAGAETETTCKCGPDTTATKTGECLLEQGKVCKENADCNGDKFLECTGTTTKTCTCIQPEGAANIAWWNPKSLTCELLLGTLCSEATDSQKCVSGANAACLKVGASTTLACQCNAGTGATDQGLEASADAKTCYATADKYCDAADTNLGVCNPTKFLTCGADKKCGCGADAVANAAKTCVLLADKPCETAADKQKCNVRSECKEGAEAGKGVCACDATSTKNKDLLCKLNGGEACEGTADECNKESFLACNVTTGAGVCACPADSKLNGAKNLCVLGAGKECLGDATKPACDLTFSTCKDKKCACNEKLILDGDVCAAGFNETCSSTAGEIGCAASKNMACGTNSRCACTSGYGYNSTRATCYGALNSTCADNTDCNDGEEVWQVCGTSKKCECHVDHEYNEDAKKCGANTFTLSLAALLIALASFFARNN